MLWLLLCNMLPREGKSDFQRQTSCLQDFEERVEQFDQADAEHITFFRSNPQLFAVSSCKGEVINDPTFLHTTASAM